MLLGVRRVTILGSIMSAVMGISTRVPADVGGLAARRPSIIATPGGCGTSATVVGLVHVVSMIVVPFRPETRGGALR